MSQNINYVSALLRLLSDGWQTSPILVLKSVLLSIFGGFLQICSLLILTQLIQSDGQFVIPETVGGFKVPGYLQFEFSLIAASILVMCLLLLSAWMIYIASVATLELSIELEKTATTKSIVAYRSSDREMIGNDNDPTEILMEKIAISYPRVLGRVLRSMLVLPQFALQSIILFILLIPIDAFSTVLVFFILLCSFTLQIRINRKGALLSNYFENSTPIAQKTKKEILAFYRESEISKSGLENELNADAINIDQSNYFNRLKVMDESALVGGITISVVVLVLVVSPYLSNLENPSVVDWARQISFILLAIFFLRSVQGSVQIMTFITRFHFQITRFYWLLNIERRN